MRRRRQDFGEEPHCDFDSFSLGQEGGRAVELCSLAG